jgi:TRAP-type mannitol/chloroaromatic compound transport system substrate-binding protein
MRYILPFLFICSCLSVSSADIPFRSFGNSEAIGPPAEVFADRLHEVTKTMGIGEIVFTRIPRVPPIPPQFFGDIVAAVAAGSSDGGFDAAYTSGSELNKTWGFLFNSGIPFGPSFDEYLGFLYGQGLTMVQEALESRGVVAYPIAGGSEQLSGYFKEPLNDVGKKKGIGLAGLCQQNWTLRFLPPGENVIKAACVELKSSHKIDKIKLNFVQAIPGSGSLIDAVYKNQLSGFEFATPLDDISQLFSETMTPSTVGLNYVHTPGWHQPFLITWMIIKRSVWDSFSEQQRMAIRIVAEESVIQSYSYNMRRQGSALQTIISTPGTVLVEWPAQDLVLLKSVTNRVLDARTLDASLPKIDRDVYSSMLTALRFYIRNNFRYWSSSRKIP